VSDGDGSSWWVDAPVAVVHGFLIRCKWRVYEGRIEWVIEEEEEEEEEKSEKNVCVCVCV